MQKPIIGFVGEFYVRANAFSNQDVIRKIEALGGEVWAAPVLEWFLYRNVRRAMRARLAGDCKLLGQEPRDGLCHEEATSTSYAHVFHGFLRNADEPSSDEVLEMAAPYVHRSFEGEAIMTVGKAIDFVAQGPGGHRRRDAVHLHAGHDLATRS